MSIDSITVSDGTNSFTYNQVSLKSTSKSSEAIYRDAASTLALPKTIRVSHELAPSVTGTDRHLVQFNTTELDNDVPYTGSAHVVFAAPRKGVSSADMLVEWKKLKDLVDDHFDLLLGGFFPG
jgi:hypothetical protein